MRLEARHRVRAPRARRRTGDSRGGPRARTRREVRSRCSYFENLSGVKEDEYLRDGDHRGHHHRAVEDQGPEDLLASDGARRTATSRCTPAQIGQQLKAPPTCSRGSLRRARATGCGSTPSSSDTRTDFAALVGALRPRDGRRVRGAGRDRAQDRRGAARSRSRRRSRRRSRPSRPTTCRPTTSTCAARATRAGSRARTSSSRCRCSRARWRHGPRLRARLRGDRQRVRASTTSTSSATQTWIGARAWRPRSAAVALQPAPARGHRSRRAGSCYTQAS